MMGEIKAICFESTSEAKLFEELRPGCIDAFTAEDIVTRVVPEPTLSAEDREAQWKVLVPTDEERPAMMETIRLLRESLVLTHDDADFALSHLSVTPKNARLKEIFHQYLDSPLGLDATARATLAVERLKALAGGLELPPHIGFARGGNRSPLFDELAKAFAAFPGVEAHLLEPWQIPVDRPRPRRAAILRGTPASTLPRLADRVARLIARGTPAEKIEIALHASPQSISFLQYLFDSRRIKYRSLLPPPTAPMPAVGDLPRMLSSLRRDRQKPLKDRLRLSSALLKASRGKRSREAWPDYLAREATTGKFSEQDLAYLLGLTAAEPIANVEPNAVTLFPALPFPVPQSQVRLAYIDKNFFASTSSEILLKQGELDALANAGFRLPQATETKRHRTRALESLCTGPAAAATLFTELSSGQMPAKRSFSLRARIAAPRHREESRMPRVNIDIKSLSATQLELYANCPSAYFFSKTLRADRQDSSDRQYALWMGQAVHLTLERALKRPEGVTNWEQELEIALKEVAPGLAENHPIYLALRAQCRQLLKKFPALEKQLRELFGDIKTEELERPFRLVLEGVPLTGKIDRIDRLADGTAIILDYKTGNVDFTPEHMRRGENFQALLYLLSIDPPGASKLTCVGMLFYDLKKGELRRGILIEERVTKEAKKMVTRGHTLPEEKFLELRGEGISRLTALARAIAAGDFHPTPSLGSCSMCDFAAHCREAAGYV